MKKSILWLLIICPMYAFSNSGSVSSKVDFVQTSVFGGVGEAVLIQFKTFPSTPADCADEDDGRMIASLETDAGKAILSMALAAKLADATVFVGGNGDCLGSLEKIRYMRVL